MKKEVLALCAAGLFLTTLATPASALSLQVTKKSIVSTATAAIQKPNANVPDQAGTISFENVESRIRKGNPAVLSLQASLDAQKAFNRDVASKELVDAINGLADMAWNMSAIPGAAASMNANIDALKKQLDAIKEDEYQETLERVTRQIENAMDQVILGGQSLYLSILTYEVNLSDMERALSALERSVSEMEKRYQLGQVSELALQQLKTTQQSTKSQAESMKLAISKMKSSLSYLLGENQNASLTLTGLKQDYKQTNSLLSMDYPTALKLAKEKSFAIYSADKTLKDAKEAWDDAKEDYGMSGYKYKMAEQTYQSAVYTHDASVKNFELSLQALYQTIPEAQLGYNTAEFALRNQEKVYAAAQVKYAQGQISGYQLQAAKEELLAAQSALQSANIKLFTVLNQYEWAVERGVIG